MVFKSLKGLFGGPAQTTAAPAATGPFGLGLGRAVVLETLRLRLEESRLAMRLPPETMVITGHGVASLDASGLLHRFYDDDGAMLQVLCSGGIGDANIQEITLYHLWDEVVPTTSAEWAAWDGPGGKIGAAIFEADGFGFERVWGQPDTPWVPPAEFTEEVTVSEGSVRRLHQKIMPYRREVGSLLETLVIAVERDLASNDRGSVTFMIGYGLAISDVNPV
jgi:uncharacterized protein DUF2491